MCKLSIPAGELPSAPLELLPAPPKLLRGALAATTEWKEIKSYKMSINNRDQDLNFIKSNGSEIVH